MRHPARSLVIGLLVIGIGSTATAQSVATGAITGTLTDPSKKAMRSAKVVARDIDTKREATATTDDDGRFRIVGLQPGSYIVEVTAPGSPSIAVANIVVEVGRATTVDVALDSATALAGLASTHTPGINTTRQDFSVNLNQTSFNDLPNNGVQALFNLDQPDTDRFHRMSSQWRGGRDFNLSEGVWS